MEKKIKDMLAHGRTSETAEGRMETTQPQGWVTAEGAAGYGTMVGPASAGYSTISGTTMHTGTAPEGAYATGTSPAFVQTTTTAHTHAVGETAPEVYGRETFTKIEDRPVIIERKEYVKEHTPMEREFVVETRATGVERPLPVTAEVIGVEERIVKETSKPRE